MCSSVGFSRQILNIVRVSNQLETEANSLERIQSYLEIEKEPAPTESGVPPAYWPASGALRVENLAVRYSADGPVVLDDISFEVKAGERVGIGEFLVLVSTCNILTSTPSYSWSHR
jgi:ABC-type bacteriocin/lantibiotic exporter with double-glycine peptidase domain